jgi:hypothetical protein
VREPAERSRIERFLQTLGRRLRHPVRLYLVGGAIVVGLGLRSATVDVDYVVQADDPTALDEFERLVPALKKELHVNVKPAGPTDFLPVPPNVLDRSRYVRGYANVSVYYYDLPSTIISKIARGAERDLTDVESLVQAGQVSWSDVESTWAEIRVSPRGWLRHDPNAIDARIRAMRERLSIAEK